MSVDGPPSPTTRLVLITLSLHMKDDGSGAFPSEAKLASETGLSERAVRTHLALAEHDGWIVRKKPRAYGRAWANYHYWPTLPARIRGAEASSGAKIGGAEGQSKGPETHGSEVRKDVPPNSAVNAARNSKNIEKSPSKEADAFFEEWRQKFHKTHVVSG